MTELTQTVVNWALGAASAVGGYILHTVWQAVKDLQASDKDLVEKVNKIEVIVVGEYLKRDEFNKLSDALFQKLDRIEDRLREKADKADTPGTKRSGGR
jgi:hypothetical protein